jgi:hypothetical protein
LSHRALAAKPPLKSRIPFDTQWYNKVEDYKNKHPDLNKEPVDIEELVRLGQTQGVRGNLMQRRFSDSHFGVSFDCTLNADAHLFHAPKAERASAC